MTHVLDPALKILDRPSLLDRLGRPRSGKLVFTNGCFDLLHRGHVEYLARARALGDLLVVAVNSDDSVRRLDKQSDRPLVAQEDRALVIAALGMVDAVTIFDESTPAELIDALLPDILVKGGDYAIEQVVGREAVEAAGGVVRILPFVGGFSTTALVRKIRGEG